MALKICNFTPHEVTIVSPSAVQMERTGACFIREDVPFEDAILQRIPVSGTSLTVQEDASLPQSIGSLRLYSQLGNARFDRVIPRDVIEGNDIIIVSSKCARLLLVICNILVISGANTVDGNLRDVFDIDRFYTPKSIVHRKDQDGKYIPIGALGLQQVAPSIKIGEYARRIQERPDMEIPVSGAGAFKEYASYQKISKEYGLGELVEPEIVRKWLENRGLLKKEVIL